MFKKLIVPALVLLAFTIGVMAQTIGTGTATQRSPLSNYYGYERSAAIDTVAVNSVNVVTAFPYTEDFEASNGGYVAATPNGIGDWQYGTPAKTQIAGAHSGTKAWATKLIGNYSSNSQSTLTSPSFDFSSITRRPELSFWQNFKTQNPFDAVNVYYSINGGPWTPIDPTPGTGGTFNTTDSTYWYNNNTPGSAIDVPNFTGSSTAYTGAAAGYIKSTTLLPAAVIGQANVRFLWAFASNESVEDEGFAIDDISIKSGVSGNITVGAGGNYPTLTAAINRLHLLGVSGATTLILLDSTYNTGSGETFPLTLNAVAGSSAVNTITIKPAAGVTPSISGSAAGCIINLNGADYVTIDGSNAVGGTSRDLTITNTNAGTSSAVVCLISTGVNAGATNNVIKNNNLIGSTVTSTAGTLAGVFSGGSIISITGAGADNDNNTIQNNNITKTSYGIYSGGASAANKNTGTVITQNVMNAASPNNITTGGVLALFEDGIQITQNDISVLKHDGTNGTFETAFGIALGVVPNNNSTVFTGSDVTNAQVRRNRINGVTQLSAGGYSSFGIVVNSVTSGTTQLSNNMITGVISSPISNNFSAGILAGGGTGSTTQIYYNSVSMTGQRGDNTTNPSFALAIGSGNPVVDVKNNILYNTQISDSLGKFYAIANASSPSLNNMTSNYNELFVSGFFGFIGHVSGFTAAGNNDRATLADWQAATGGDADSISSDPLFVNPLNDLHLTALSPAISAGTPITIYNDFDSDLRDNTPDIGADEIVSGFSGTVPAGTYNNAILNDGATLGGNVTIKGTLTLNGIVVTNENTLTIDCGATISGASASNYVVGNLRKNFCTTESFTYPVGDNTGTVEYSPFTANITALGTNPSALTVNVVDAVLPGLNTAQSASRYFNLTETGDLTANLAFNYVEADVVGDETTYKLYKREMGMITLIPSTIDTVANTITTNGISDFSDWGIGNLAPTAAAVNVGGRVITQTGRGIAGARVRMIDGQGNFVIRQTNSSGYFRFADVAAGETYILSVGHKTLTFAQPSQVISVNDEFFGILFVATGQNQDVSDTPPNVPKNKE